MATQTDTRKIDRIEGLAEAMEKWNARWLAAGKRLTSYQCPHCEHTIAVRCPDPEDVAEKGYWDSLTLCIVCGEMCFLLTWPDGDVDALIPDMLP